ncbi:pimeloyl-ACP methyl ester carboxylesterase [Murinocardiopsis flavida]|uniref:Pimeloyl-ACP methyl ester carboxylesterase n=2 Tax=Murinocardiopsis flavida TaxID=645275 RepID=A0A2P8CF08_9ACTN|nr:pimeloyl-ACP methyl ester carboxylesterase [Murinocardiopsis flavida]
MDWTLDEHLDTPSGTVRWASWGDGPPLVFLHGTPFSSYVWRRLADRFAATHRVYVWDMPGFGQSEMRAGQDVSLAAQQGVFTRLLAHWGLREPAVVAHDFGGAVALRTALLDGVRYERLALLDAVSVRPWGTGYFRLMHDNPEVFGALPGYLHRAMVRAHIATAAHTDLGDTLLDRLLEPWTGAAGQAAYTAVAAQNDEHDTAEVEDRYAELDMPVLIGWGREDRWLPVPRAEDLARRIPHAQLAWIERAGHLVQEDAPDQVATLLADFLARR